MGLGLREDEEGGVFFGFFFVAWFGTVAGLGRFAVHLGVGVEGGGVFQTTRSPQTTPSLLEHGPLPLELAAVGISLTPR